MTEGKVPYLSGCVLYLLLREATLPDATPRQHKDGVKDEHKNPDFMADLVYTFTGVQTKGIGTDTSNYREGKSEGTVNVPFNSPGNISTYNYTVRNRYTDALNRMCDFVRWHLNPEMREWLVKACLDVIENDEDIADTDLFCVRSNGDFLSKAELKSESVFELQPFLIGVLHYILTHRAGKNSLGIPTMAANSEKVKYKERQYKGNLGDNITRLITVTMCEKPKATPEVPIINEEPVLMPDAVMDKSDDEVIEDAMHRVGKQMTATLGAVDIPKANTEGIAKALATVAAVSKECTPDNAQENLVRGISAMAAAFEAQKHDLAEKIRNSVGKEEADSGTDMPEPDVEPAHQESRTTIIQQQTNVIQNGDNNVNVTNNGTMNFNF